MARPIDPDRRDLRQMQILDVVEALVSARGLEALTIQSVIRQTGLSAGVVYHHFANKDAILEALVARQNRGTDELIAALQGPHTVRDVLSYSADEMLDYLCAPQAARLNVELAFQAKSGAPWAQMLRDSDARLAEALQAAITRDIAAGNLARDTDAAACCCLIFALWEGLVSRAAAGAVPSQATLIWHYRKAIEGILPK